MAGSDIGPGFGHLLRLMLVAKPLVAKDWQHPENEADYERMLDEQGFIVPSRWKDLKLGEFPTIVDDLDILEKYLLPVFWEFNQKAKYHQNRYHYYQRIFLIAALLTTLVSVVNGYVLSVGDEMQQVANWFNPDIVSFLLGFATAIISARASYYTLLANYGEPRQRWAHYRRLTEELRITYFKFMAHMPSYDGVNRVTQLRQDILTLRLQEQEDG